MDTDKAGIENMLEQAARANEDESVRQARGLNEA